MPSGSMSVAFGKDVPVSNIRQNTFDITVTVDISRTFFAWMTQFVGEMVLVSPSNVRDAYADYLLQAIDDALS